jgi:peptidoglycan hydrolase-like protein with peptidoglycan-binding domain
MLMALFAMAWPSSATTTTKTTKRRVTHPTVTSSKGVKHKSASGKTATGRTTTGKTASGKTAKGKAVAKTARTTRRSYQQSPTPERYKEIQQALATKGYFQGEPNGEWGPDSQAALKRFQTEQNLTSDGKLSSMSLIALGLGPKRFSAQSHSQPAPEPAKPEVPQ